MTLTFDSTSFQGHFSRCKSAARAWLAVAAVAGLFQTFAPLTASAQTTVQLAQTPLLALKTTPGLVMLTMSRDHRLFYTAYNDTSDLDGDGLIDVGFKPAITYYGYFASDRCYRYESSTAPNRFVPTDFADATTICNTKTGRWNGNWLNWALTSRMDALRKVLYGGYRQTDTLGKTILEAANIPGDSHVWGKEYRPKSVVGFTGYNAATPATVGTATPIYGAAIDAGYKIENYTPLAAPNVGKMHVFLVKSEGDSNSVYQNRKVPTFRVQANVDAMIDRVWLWSSSERPIGGANGTFQYIRPAGCFTSAGLPGVQSCSAALATYADFRPVATKYAGNNYGTATYALEVRAETCVPLGASNARESNCTGYPAAAPTTYKPTGVLHEYGEVDSLKFGLITGSYLNNYSGGVVRKDLGSFKDEVDLTTGKFSSVVGIAKTIDRLTTYGFDGSSSYAYDCGFNFTSLRTQGQCQMWGAPVAEMMYEGLRYFAAKGPTNAFITGVSAATSPDSRLGLPLVSTWTNPFRPKASGGSPMCSRPVQMVIADPITSFDSDQLPGAAFPITTNYGSALGASPGDLNGTVTLNVATEADAIWNKELLAGNASAVPPIPNGTLLTSSKKFFVGQTTLINADGNPTAKAATTFSTMRGHGPDETNTQGSYYAASVAKFGHEQGVKITNGVTGAGSDSRVVTVDNISLALGSTIPRIEIKYAGKAVTLVPFSKSVGSNGINGAKGQFQPTGLITLTYIDSIFNTHASNVNAAVNSGRPYIRFMVSFSDMDQGGDNEADANVYYTLYVNAAGKLIVELETYYQAGSIQQNMGYIISGTTKDGVYLEVADEAPANPIYYLDTLPGQDPAPAAGRTNTIKLTKTSTRTFDLGAGSSGEFVPKDPLWYAAKYGGGTAFDSKNDPTNYFKVTNAADLPSQMGKAFKSAAAIAAVASTSVVGVGQRSLGSAAIYQANYDSLTWTSRLYAFSVLGNGTVSNTSLWEAASILPAPASRTNLYLGRGGNSTPFALLSGNYGLLGTSGTPSEQADFGNASTYEYLIGDKSLEERKGGNFRNRGGNGATDVGSALGDIVNSDPQIISKKDYGYTASDPTGASSYPNFLSSITTESLAVGSNDGFFHVFNAAPTATGGGELFGFMPQAARRSIKDLASPNYAHRYFVDGSIGLGHAKIPVPGDSTTSWRSIAVVAGGAGVKTVFAVNTTSQSYSADSVLWEINENTGLPIANTLGNVMGRPAIGKLKNGTWVAIFGNGFNSTAGTANLFVVRLSDGNILKEIPTNASILGNGLGSTEIVMSTTGNKDTIDYVYGADYKGNIWRFDISSSSSSSWSANGALVYSTPTGRPITAEIKIGDAPTVAATLGGKMIYFGTGSYLNAGDASNTTVQALYGVFDDLLYTLNTAPGVLETSLVSNTLSMTATTADTRTTSAPASAWYTQIGKKGWVLPLTGTNVAAGERVIAPPVRYTIPGKLDAFLFTSIVPGTDDCLSGVDAWITGVDALTGGYKQVFDGLLPNSVKVVGGSPRGVFVLQDGADPSLYISQTIFNGNVATTSYGTSAGGQQTVTINGVQGTTQILGIKLAKQNVAAAGSRQVWRQLK